MKKALCVLIGLVPCFTAAAAMPGRTDTARHNISAGMQIDMNGLKAVCATGDSHAPVDADCVFGRIKEKMALMQMAKTDGANGCPVDIETRSISEIFVHLLTTNPADAELVDSYDRVNALYDNIRMACTVLGAS